MYVRIWCLCAIPGGLCARGCGSVPAAGGVSLPEPAHQILADHRARERNGVGAHLARGDIRGVCCVGRIRFHTFVYWVTEIGTCGASLTASEEFFVAALAHWSVVPGFKPEKHRSLRALFPLDAPVCGYTVLPFLYLCSIHDVVMLLFVFFCDRTF